MNQTVTLQDFFDRLDDATRNAETEQVCSAVKDALIQSIDAGLKLPEEVLRTSETSYARHLLHKAEDGRYAVIVMVWGAGQGTPIHDHDDKWCVECVYQGRIRVESYAVREEAGNRYRFEQEDCIEAGVGVAGSLIPPFDHHIIANSGEQAAVTIHVYGGEMQGCHTFAPTEDGWHQRSYQALGYAD